MKSNAPLRVPSLALVLTVALSSTTWAALKAFPTAEGVGQNAMGARGGTVYEVTNLNDAGAGSFRDAVSQPNRTVVFRVGGYVRLKSRVFVASNITVAGQTAPGDGITLLGGGLYIGASNNAPSNHVVMRHIRVRIPSGLKQNQATSGIPATDVAATAAWDAQYNSDGITVLKGSHMVFDHVSVGWGADGNFDINSNFTRELDSITIQNSIIAYGRKDHSTGGLVQTNGHISILRSLYANNKTRNPKATCNNQFVNNVLYNWNAASYNFGGAAFETKSNLINNYMINGSWGGRSGIMGGSPATLAYISGNRWDNNLDGTLNGREYTEADFTQNSPTLTRSLQAHPFPAVTQMTANEAYAWVLANAGASRVRDDLDKITIETVKSLGKAGFGIRTEDTLFPNGLPTLKSGTAPVDTDKDGMSDAWEKTNGLNPNDPMDRNATNLSVDGYTNLEVYLNELVGEPVARRAAGAPLVYATASATSITTAGVIDVTTTPSDKNGSIARVELLRNGKVIATRTTAPWTLQATNFTIGNHWLQVRAVDNSGLTSIAVAMPVTVTSQAPIAALQANILQIQAPASLTLNATLSDNDGTVQKAAFLKGVGESWLALDTLEAAPWSVPVSNLGIGRHRFLVNAQDNNGVWGRSSELVVSVIPSAASLRMTSTVSATGLQVQFNMDSLPEFTPAVRITDLNGSGKVNWTSDAGKFKGLRTILVPQVASLPAGQYVVTLNVGPTTFGTQVINVGGYSANLLASKTPNELYAKFTLPTGYSSATPVMLQVIRKGAASVGWTQSYTGLSSGANTVKFGTKFIKKNTGTFVMQLVVGGQVTATTEFTNF